MHFHIRDRLTALLRIGNETIFILLLKVRPKFSLPLDMSGSLLSTLISLLFIWGISTVRSIDFRLHVPTMYLKVFGAVRPFFGRWN